ncbi:MAG TPA: ribonuclease HII [Candidatus Binatia bacterium]|nr:ribonuclease HII [Candidatus Binatia bacterium]
MRLTERSLDALRARLLGGDRPISAQTLNRLKRDPRRGARLLYDILKRKYEKERAERLRLDSMLNFERVLWKSGVRAIAGVDEAGSGPLAGPVVAAAVVFPAGIEIAGMNDSKQVDAEARNELEKVIRRAASAVAIGMADVGEIDDINIYQAALLAMRRAVEALPSAPDHLLIDARTIPGVAIPQNAFSKGDGINFSIAAASIIAKTHRDRLMEELEKKYPGYGFTRHKGYGTPEHQEAIRRLGPSPVHRLSFGLIRELCGEFSPLFYTLKRRLEEADAAAALTAFEAAFKEARPALEEREQRKLQIMQRRRWKTI